jgi:hypothetical protein
MKLVFTGEKVLEEMAVDSSEVGTTREVQKAAVISRINKLFEGGFRVPLKGMEVPVISYPSRTIAHYNDCERVDEPVLEGKVLTIRTDAERIVSPDQFDFDIYSFGARQLVESVRDYLKQKASEAGRQDTYDAIFGKMGDRELIKYLVTFLMPKSPRISTEHFMLFREDGHDLYVADKGTIVGTWADDVKMGYDYSNWDHWGELNPEKQARKAGCSTFDVMIDVLDANGETIHGSQALYNDGAHLVRRTMNAGHLRVNDGSKIALGSDNFRTAEGRPHYEFTLKEG